MLGRPINPGSCFTLHGNGLIRKSITPRGIHSYHPHHLIHALDFVMLNHEWLPFNEIVDSRFGLDLLGQALQIAAEHRALRAEIVPRPESVP